MSRELYSGQTVDPTPPVGLQKLLANSPDLIPVLEANDRRIAGQTISKWTRRSNEPNIHYRSLLTTFYEAQDYGTVVWAYDTVIRSSINTILDSPTGRELVRGVVPVIRTILQSEIEAAPKATDVHGELTARLRTLNALQITPVVGVPERLRGNRPDRGTQRRVRQMTGRRSGRMRAS